LYKKLVEVVEQRYFGGQNNGVAPYLKNAVHRMKQSEDPLQMDMDELAGSIADRLINEVDNEVEERYDTDDGDTPHGSTIGVRNELLQLAEQLENGTVDAAELEIAMYECDACGKRFLTKRAEHGHQAMCPENPDRTTPDKWSASGHGRWSND
jgi:uncharacterized protein YlaI